jgi:hypothetical protein
MESSAIFVFSLNNPIMLIGLQIVNFVTIKK